MILPGVRMELLDLAKLLNRVAEDTSNAKSPRSLELRAHLARVCKSCRFKLSSKVVQLGELRLVGEGDRHIEVVERLQSFPLCGCGDRWLDQRKVVLPSGGKNND